MPSFEWCDVDLPRLQLTSSALFHLLCRPLTFGRRVNFGRAENKNG
jgi:hypothetical protein